MTVQLTEEGDRLAARGKYAAAVVKYQAAVNQEPTDLSFRYALGVALSHLGRRQETVEQFRWVVSRGEPGSPEVQVARRWLAAAGELDVPVTFTPSTASMETPNDPATLGTVKGLTQWTGVDPTKRLVLVQMFLTGKDDSNQHVRFSRAFKLGGPYQFANVPAGNYRLVAEAAETPLWDQKLTVEAGRDRVLDLTNTNSSVPSDQLPVPAPVE